MNYSDFQNQVSSEKLTLAVLHASKRLMAWTLDSGSIYKITNFDVAAIVSIEDSGTAYVEVDSLALVTASKFYNDRENKILYLRTTGSDNPNSRFLVLTFKLFFSTAPITLPHDLLTGTEVYWEPMLKSTSTFGVEIDTINQTSEAIEGSGTLTLFNDSSFWPSNFDKLVFENKPCYIYSYNRDIPVDQSKLIFLGFVEKRSYSSTSVKFSLKDLMAELKAPLPLLNIKDLGLRTAPNLALAKQRMIFGRVKGHRPVNTDEVLTGYPVTGTVSVNIGSTSLVGVGTSFLTKVAPDDALVLNSVEYVVATVTSNTAITLTESYTGTTNLSAAIITIKPKEPRRYMNRTWKIAGHSLRQPTTTISLGSTITRLIVGSTQDIYDGDWVYVGTLGSGELVRVNNVISSKLITLSSSLITVPSVGTTLFKPAVQNVRMGDLLLTYNRDYSVDPTTATLTLSPDAEKNASQIRQTANNLTFNSTRTVTGTGLDTTLKTGDVVSCVGQADFFEVLSVDSSTQVTLRTSATFSSTAKGLFKTTVLDPSKTVLTCDVLGRTFDGTPTGYLLSCAPDIVKTLLTDLGLTSLIDEASFIEAKEIAYQPLGIVFPEKYTETKTPIYREALNKINQSMLGALVQTQAFKLSYLVLHPEKSQTALKVSEADILDISTQSSSDKIVKTVKVTYAPKEYDYLTLTNSVSTQQKTSDLANYVTKTEKEKTSTTYLCDLADADTQAGRLSFILENSATSINLNLKLLGISLEVGSIVEISYSKIYERVGSKSKRKLAMVEAVKKSGTGVSVELVDLSNAFNRVSAWVDGTDSWSETNDDGRLYGGFLTDDYGLINNDPDSFGANLIW